MFHILFCSFKLSPAIVGGLHNIARTIESRSYAEGLNIHTHIVSSCNFSETSAFMPVLKVVLTQANKLGVWAVNKPHSIQSVWPVDTNRIGISVGCKIKGIVSQREHCFCDAYLMKMCKKVLMSAIHDFIKKPGCQSYWVVKVLHWSCANRASSLKVFPP